MKLDSVTRREWQREGSLNEFSTMDKFLSFLNHKCQMLEAMSAQTKRFKNGSIAESKSKPERVHTTLKSFVASHSGCAFCRDTSHYIQNCQTFLQLSVTARRKEAGKAKLCWNCLKFGHRVNRCTYRHCTRCGEKHNVLLHAEQWAPETEATSGHRATPNRAEVPQTSSSGRQVFNGHNSSTIGENGNFSEILLSTAIVSIADEAGCLHNCRALLDSGSQSSFMTRELRDKLRLASKVTNMSILGIGSGVTNITHYVTTQVHSNNSDYNFSSTFLLVDKISDSIPLVSIKSNSMIIPECIKLADSTFGNSGKIDLLLGVTIFWDLLGEGKIKLGGNSPILQETKLGWIVSGSVPTVGYDKRVQPKFQSCNFAAGLSIQDQLEKFWTLEEYPREKLLSREENKCEVNFSETTTRDVEGRFIVSLPIKSGVQDLGNSYNMALKRLHHLERKFSRNEEFRLDYHNFMREYISLGHMSKIGSETGVSQIKDQGKNIFMAQGPGIYYLPHHGVVKETSVTTKLRVVFDASAATDNGISLNNRLMVGPKLQDDIFCILIRFRKHLVVVAADIEKMYRQVLVQEDQRDLQRILWRFSADQPVSQYRMNTVTYGTASAPYLAVRCLQQLGLENESHFPQAARVILKDFYVDDLLSGANSIPEARKLKDEVSQILEGGGFILRKWMSNFKEAITDRDDDCKVKHYISDDDSTSKTLGLLWNSRNDSLHFQVNLNNTELNEKVTKRSILSLASRVFDPLGLVGPVVIRTKLMLQLLWKLKLGWDNAVPTEIESSWVKFRDQFEALKLLNIPRHIVCPEPTEIQLHGFCDASQVAYGAAIYVRSTDKGGNYHTHLMCAKSRVAPVKVVSLPRLELCGALLLARLLRIVVETADIKFGRIRLWCDSTVVLSWLAGEPVQWSTFVANRVAEIQRIMQELKCEVIWSHVRSEENPADVISRGLDCSQLQVHRLWWQGPHWLQQDERSWPESSSLNAVEVPERRVVKHSFTLKHKVDWFNRFSSLSRLQRVTAFMLRFCKNCRLSRNERNFGTLTVNEINTAMVKLIKFAQAEEYVAEIHALEKTASISNSSKLISLNPFLDKEGILRLGGRLGKSDLGYDQKFPIILPSKHNLTRLIIINEHYRLLHAGPQALLAQLRLKYWPVSGRKIVRGVLRSCVVCFRVRPRELRNIMGELPRSRITPSKPFTNVGVDYAGPFDTRVNKIRGCTNVKSYLCLFICFATRAVHLEVVCDLTTQSFLNCFKRFVARRGICQNIYSDNATNFVGANNELQEVHNFLQNTKSQESFSEYFSHLSIKWHFIPPRSPHFGGLWEAAVKSAKYHFKRVVGKQKLTFEELATVMTQIESCLNSRPLTPLTENPEDLNAITPGHFLIGTSLSALPQEELARHNPGKLERYHLMTQMVQHFWTRWSREYLSQLQQRTKWRSGSASVKIGSMVIIKDENLPPLNWPLARVVELHPGSDNRCRVVTLKTQKGICKRAVSQLCVLPIEQANNGPETECLV